MNEIFELRKKLNIKKIIFFSIICLFILVVLIEIVSNMFNKKNNTKSISTTSTFYDENKSLSIVLPNKYGLEKLNSNKDYLIELKSPQNLTILISKKELINGRKLSNIIFADRKSYIKNFNEPSNISEISSIPINNDLEAYTYNFNYLIENQKLNLQTIWIESQNCYYIIDISIPLEVKDTYSNLTREITSTFTLIEENT